jgi:hypothetical protein
MTRARDVADTQDNLGGAVPPVTTGKNFCINGGFDIWQRGTSFSSISYSADRWYTTAGSTTISRQSTNPPVGSQYYLRNTATANAAASDSFTYFETSQIAPLWGRTVTISVKVRRNATFTADVFFRLDKSSTVDATGAAAFTTMTPISGSNGTNIGEPNASITTGTGASNWTTLYRTYELPNDGTANSIRVIVYQGATVPSGSVLDIAQVQVEAGSVATPFSRAGGTIQGELAACQRYFSKSYNQSAAPGSATFEGFVYSGGNAVNTTGYLGAEITYPVRMRIAPTLTTYDAAYTGGRVSRVAPAVADQNNITPTTAFNSEKGCLVQSSSGNNLSGLGFQWTASAEL